MWPIGDRPPTQKWPPLSSTSISRGRRDKSRWQKLVVGDCSDVADLFEKIASENLFGVARKGEIAHLSCEKVDLDVTAPLSSLNFAKPIEVHLRKSGLEPLAAVILRRFQTVLFACSRLFKSLSRTNRAQAHQSNCRSYFSVFRSLFFFSWVCRTRVLQI